MTSAEIVKPIPVSVAGRAGIAVAVSTQHRTAIVIFSDGQWRSEPTADLVRLTGAAAKEAVRGFGVETE